MVTQDKEIVIANGSATTNQTYYGKSTDSKPTDCGNGSCFIEMDTGKVYFFNLAGNAWIEVGG